MKQSTHLEIKWVQQYDKQRKIIQNKKEDKKEEK